MAWFIFGIILLLIGIISTVVRKSARDQDYRAVALTIAMLAFVGGLFTIVSCIRTA